MRGARTSVVASMETQSRPKCWLTVTSVMVERNPRRQAMKTASGALLKRNPSSVSALVAPLSFCKNPTAETETARSARWPTRW